MKAGEQSYVTPIALVQAALLLFGCDAGDQPAANTAIATAEAPPPVAETPIAGPKRIVLTFGDSLYAGYGLKRGQGLPDALERRLRAAGINATVFNAGMSGDTSAAGQRRLTYTLDRLERAPDIVLLGLGGNDVLRQVDPAETRTNLTAMLDELKRRRIPVVLTGMLAAPNLGPDFATRFNAIYPDLAKANGATLDPFILDGVIGKRALMLPDGVHPNVAGVNRIADRLAPMLQERLASEHRP